jgi:hypothetical protein
MELEVETQEEMPGELAEQPIWKRRLIMAAAALIIVAILVGIGFAVAAMVQHPARTETIRDIVIIFMAVESLIIGLALILMLVQIARLTALVQNEIKPMLDATNETLNTLRGTTVFLSNNLVKPVTKLNSSIAAVKRALEFIIPGRR